MYVFDAFLDDVVEKTLLTEWPSDDHREVAKKVCLCNPCVASMSVLVQNVRVIVGIPADKIKEITVDDLIMMGCTV